MFNESLLEAVKQYRDKERKNPQDQKVSELQKKLSQEQKENYEGWLNDPITNEILKSFENELLHNNMKLLKCALQSGRDEPVKERDILYFSLRNKVINEMLKVLQGNPLKIAEVIEEEKEEM